MSNRHWTPTTCLLPPEGLVVETMSPQGLVQDLKRQGRLWFVPDGSMYVYYDIAYWRARPGGEKPREGGA